MVKGVVKSEMYRCIENISLTSIRKTVSWNTNALQKSMISLDCSVVSLKSYYARKFTIVYSNFTLSFKQCWRADYGLTKSSPTILRKKDGGIFVVKKRQIFPACRSALQCVTAFCAYRTMKQRENAVIRFLVCVSLSQTRKRTLCNVLHNCILAIIAARHRAIAR